jgi:hypothetical protein
MTFCCLLGYKIMNQFFFAEKNTFCQNDIRWQWHQNCFIWMWVTYLWKEHFINFFKQAPYEILVLTEQKLWSFLVQVAWQRTQFLWLFAHIVHKNCRLLGAKILQYCFHWDLWACQLLLKSEVRLKVPLFCDDLARNDSNIDFKYLIRRGCWGKHLTLGWRN